mmetsp:Transcript_25463/g.29615  ORF Transcript_25463/g.29615 Transcript_25463/m.29615 type:complete len:96 (+) Transcript_25463:199-486(+)
MLCRRDGIKVVTCDPNLNSTESFLAHRSASSLVQPTASIEKDVPPKSATAGTLARASPCAGSSGSAALLSEDFTIVMGVTNGLNEGNMLRSSSTT